MTRLFLTAALALTACAHQQKPAEPAAEAPAAAPMEQKVAQAPAPAKVVDQSAADLDALLKGLVIHFGFDAADLSPESRQRLDTLADALRARPATQLRIAGNCDELGTVEYNLALGQKRANAVRSYLVTLGVAPSRVEAITYGEEQPLDPGHTEEAWATNRRAEISPAN